MEIPVEPWNYDDFEKVILKGNRELNIGFSDNIVEKIKGISFGNIGIVQELCKETCYAAGIEIKQDEYKEINQDEFLKLAVELKASQCPLR
ncbi:hypothetical protein EIZ39_25740 [Ammoniphilus sp. CFH 90114]|nr:hypothetical protein EIZ39_25740 [Ammoniphilus sp. CFH 90114]